ncbi:MAG: hypothetical protein Q9195_003515 [Heterodermia aff. obscurata]
MAEAIGLVASIATLIQLADTVNQTASKYVRTINGAEKLLNPLVNNLRSLHTILITLGKQLDTEQDECSLSMTLQHLNEPLTICEDALRRIKLRFDSVRVIGNYVVGTLLDKQTLRHLKRLDGILPILQLALEADSLASTHALESLVRSLQLENAEQTDLLRQDIQAIHGQAEQSSKDSAQVQLRKSIMRWLAVADPLTNHRSACQRCLPGTGRWLLEDSGFMEWEVGHNNYLWLNALVIEHLVCKYGDRRVAYFYFDFKDVTKQDVLGFLSSLVLQIAGYLDALPGVLVDLFRRHSARDPDRPSIPSTFELLEVIVAVLDVRPTFYIVVDALDECRERPLLLATVTSLKERLSPNCKILLTSRWELDIQRVISKLEIRDLEARAHRVDNDISLYVRSVLESDERLSRHRQDTKAIILEKLSEGAHGMFRWVQCQVDHIKALRTAKDVKKALLELPPDLDSTYDDILLRINQTDKLYLKRALQFVAFSARPMTLAEVAEAIIIENDISEVDEDSRLQQPQDLLEIGKSLFVASYTELHDKKILELSHYSVKEYLVSERIRSGPASEFALDKTIADIHIAQCCLTYLGMDIFEREWQAFDEKTWYHHESPNDSLVTEFLVRRHRERLETYPFLAYAAKKCFIHCKDEVVQESIAQTLLKVFSTERNGRFINMTYNCVCNSNDAGMTAYTRAFRYSLISVAARYGLKVIVQTLLKNGVAADYLPPKPSWIETWPEGQTALHRAADNGYETICKILIDAGANLHGTSDRDCPLASAGRSGKPAIVKLLIESGVDVRRDPFPIAETLLIAWWKYAEGFDQWRIILDLFRDAGVRWPTVGLLAALSGSAVPYVRLLTEWIGNDSIEHITPREPLEDIQNAVDYFDMKTLTALQWLVNDPGGLAGLKSSILMVFQKIYAYQPHLFTPTATGLLQKYTLEEVFAENMINRYFNIVLSSSSGSPSSPTIPKVKTHSPTDWLASGCDLLPTPLDSELVICGPVLRAFLRNRWNPAFAHLFD